MYLFTISRKIGRGLGRHTSHYLTIDKKAVAVFLLTQFIFILPYLIIKFNLIPAVFAICLVLFALVGLLPERQKKQASEELTTSQTDEPVDINKTEEINHLQKSIEGMQKKLAQKQNV